MSEVEAIAEVLAAHALRSVDPACSCGWDWDPTGVILPSEVDFDPARYRLSDTVRPEQHRAHVAEQIARLAAVDRDTALRELTREWQRLAESSGWADPYRTVWRSCAGQVEAVLDQGHTGGDEGGGS